MDIPGVHIDGTVLVALIALVNTALLAWIGNTARRTHDAVNGIQAQAVRDARAEGVATGEGGRGPAAPPP